MQSNLQNEKKQEKKNEVLFKRNFPFLFYIFYI